MRSGAKHGTPARRMGVVYRHTVEAFIGQLVRRRNLMTDAELATFQAHPPRDLEVEQWVRFVRAVAARLSPGATDADALEEAGREMIRGYAAGLVGRSVFLVAKLMGPRRTLMRLPENYRTADNVMDATVTPRGDREVLVHFKSVFGMPTYVRGVLSEMLKELGVQSRITFEVGPLGVDYVVTWA